MGKIKNTIFTCLSITMASTLAAALCAAGTAAFAATAVDPLIPGGNIMAQASESDPARITLEDMTTGTYLLAVEPWTPDIDAALPLEVSVDGGTATELVSNVYMFGAYTAELALTEESKNLTITTTSEEEIDLSVTLYAPVATTALPDEAHPADLTMMREYTYSYTYTSETVEKGYYTMHWATQTPGAEFTVIEKVKPEYLSGTTVQDDSYPLYFENGSTYYFSVMYTGGSDSQTADVYFYFEAWEPTAIGLEERVYVPITPAAEDHVIIPFGADMTPDTYLLRLNTEPVYPEGTVITAHIVDADKNELSTATSDFNNVYDITVTEDAYGVYFTSTFNEVFVGSVIADITPSETVEFIVGEEAEVTLKRNEALTCFLMNVPATGTYDIALADLPTPSPVRVYDAYDTIVPAGATSGTFAVVMEYPTENGYPGETTKNAAITFQNNSTETITFFATITKSTENFDVELDKATTLQAPAHSSITYYVPGLTGENYLIDLTNAGADVYVYDYFNRYEPLVFANKPQAIYSFGNIALEEGRTLTYAFVVVNNSDTAEELTITFTEINTIIAGEDANNQIAVDADSSKDYYIGGITTGRYLISLSDLSNNINFTVTYNGQTVVSNERLNGYIVVNAPQGQLYAIAKLTVTNNDDQRVNFRATVTQTVDGTMVLGRAQTVTLGNDDTSETYNISLAADVEYTITVTGTIPEGVSVYAIINGNYYSLVEGTNTLTLEMDASSIEFTYFYFGTTSFTFTVTITDNIA